MGEDELDGFLRRDTIRNVNQKEQRSADAHRIISVDQLNRFLDEIWYISFSIHLLDQVSNPGKTVVQLELRFLIKLVLFDDLLCSLKQSVANSIVGEV